MIKKIMLLPFYFLLVVFSVKAQNFTCGTEPTKEDIDYFNSQKNDRDIFFKKKSSYKDVITFKVNITRVFSSKGGRRMSESESDLQIDLLNQYYSNAGIQFIKCKDKEVYDDFLFDFKVKNENRSYKYFDEGVINIIYFNTIKKGDMSLGGYTYFPKSNKEKAIYMTKSQFNNTTTIVHEMGHFFSLYHTHGKSNCGTTDELVTRGKGKNCNSKGDEICDTPADPNLFRECAYSEVKGISCKYTGIRKDSNGNLFKPDTKNVMSYSPSYCKSNLSPEQYSRVRFSATNSIFFYLANYDITLLDHNNIDNNQIKNFTPLKNGTIKSLNKIEASNQIKNSNVSYLSKNKIRLLPNFFVKKGSVFNAAIRYDCNGENILPYKRIVVKDKVRIEDEKDEVVSIYPNPSQGMFKITSLETIVNYTVLNQFGKVISNSNANTTNAEVDIQHLSVGIYFVRVALETGEIVTKKILKK